MKRGTAPGLIATYRPTATLVVRNSPGRTGIRAPSAFVIHRRSSGNREQNRRWISQIPGGRCRGRFGGRLPACHKSMPESDLRTAHASRTPLQWPNDKTVAGLSASHTLHRSGVSSGNRRLSPTLSSGGAADPRPGNRHVTSFRGMRRLLRVLKLEMSCNLNQFSGEHFGSPRSDCSLAYRLRPVSLHRRPLPDRRT